MESSKLPQNQELLTRLNEKKKQLKKNVKPRVKKAPASKPPPRLDDSTPPNSVSPSFDLRSPVSQQHISEEGEVSLSSTKSLNILPKEASSKLPQNQELLTKLNEKKKNVTPHVKKAPASKPPPRLDDSTPNGVSPSFDLRPVVSQQHISAERETPLSPTKSMNILPKENEEMLCYANISKISSNQVSSDTDSQDDSQNSSESIKPNAIYEIVQAVRQETQLSHDMSKVAVETVLISLREFLPGDAARSTIDALLCEANSNITCPKNAIDAPPDALRMMTALNALSKAANDAQEKGWALHDDAYDIQTQLLELISVMVEPEFYLGFLNNCIKNMMESSKLPQNISEEREVSLSPTKSLNILPKEENSKLSQNQDSLTKLNEKKKQLKKNVKPHVKKAPASKPPQRLDDSTPSNGVSPSFDLRSAVSQQHISEERETPLSPTKSMNILPKENEEMLWNENISKISSNPISSDTDSQDDRQDSSESIKPNAIYEIVQAVRKETQLSHDMSKVAVETVLISLREFLPGDAARSTIDALLREANSNITCPKNAIDAPPDALRMMTALNALSKTANDAQQRGWALHDDAHDIQTQLLELISVMSNADVNISQHVLSSHKYAYVTTLVQYYQMETRWPLRQLLLQAFGVMCGLERTALATLALSALPAEIARDMRDNPRAVSRLSHSALLLSMVLSMGDSLPITHFEQLGVEFAQFLLELIEDPPETDVDEQIPDLFLTLLLAYNLQFDNQFDNILLNALETRDVAKTFCEKVLLLLNREEDPVHIFDHEPAPAHSVLKIVIDLFSRKKTAEHFYTNDVKVAIDIIVRQLADLSPGDARRQQYLKILQGIIRNTDYGSHVHRRDDLLRCFARIFCEEGDTSLEDQALVRAISNEFPQHFKP